MSRDLLDQLGDYGASHEKRQPSVSADEIVALSGSARDGGPPSRRMGVAVAAAAVMVSLLVALLVVSNRLGDSSELVPADTVPVPDTTAPLSEAVPVPDAEAPVSDDLEVSPLEFFPSEAPWSGFARDGQWVQDRFVVAVGGELFWTDNGEGWSADDEFEALGVGKPDAGTEYLALAGDGTRLAVWTTRPVEQERGERCALPGDELMVAIRDADGNWSTSQLTVPRPIPDDPGCVPFSYPNVVIGPLGVLMQINEITWFSTGKGDWIPSSLNEAFDALVAGSNAFYASSDEFNATYRSTDGLNWEPDPIVSLGRTHPGSGIEYGPGEIGWWKDQLVQNREDGIHAFETNEPISTDGPKSVRRFFGPMGIFGGPRGAPPPDIYLEGGVFFSPDGNSYVAWMPAEFDLASITVLGVADDYVLLADYRTQTIWTGRAVR